MRTYVNEGGHKKGCACGFCRNKGNIHKRGKDDKKPDEKTPTAESVVAKLLDEE